MSININNLIVTMAAELLAEEEVELDAELTEKWLVFVKRTEATEDKFKPELRKAFTKQQVSVTAKMKRTPMPSIKANSPEFTRGMEVEYCQCVAVITDMVKPGMIDIRFDTEDPRNQEHYSPAWTHEKIIHERYFRAVIRIDDNVMFKGSEEAEAAAEKFVDQIYTASAWQETFTAAMLPFMTAAFKEAGQAAFTEIGIEGAFNVTNPSASKFLKDRTFESVKGNNEETREKLKRVLVKSFDAGESIPQISKRIAGVFDINRGSRTDKIARTEIVGASNNGAHQAYIDSEIVITEIWIDSRDSLVRTSPHNHKIDGEEVALGKRFSNGLLHPHDPSGAAGNVINCRCSTTPGKLKEAA